MSWINQLLQTYENNIGKKQKTDIQMTPVAHMNVKMIRWMCFAKLEDLKSEEWPVCIWERQFAVCPLWQME